jgi:hypothetical protein
MSLSSPTLAEFTRHAKLFGSESVYSTAEMHLGKKDLRRLRIELDARRDWRNDRPRAPRMTTQRSRARGQAEPPERPWQAPSARLRKDGARSAATELRNASDCASLQRAAAQMTLRWPALQSYWNGDSSDSVSSRRNAICAFSASPRAEPRSANQSPATVATLTIPTKTQAMLRPSRQLPAGTSGRRAIIHWVPTRLARRAPGHQPGRRASPRGGCALPSRRRHCDRSRSAQPCGCGRRRRRGSPGSRSPSPGPGTRAGPRSSARSRGTAAVSYTKQRAHETLNNLV